MSELDKLIEEHIPKRVLDTKTKQLDINSKQYNIDFSLTDTAIVIEFKFQDTIEAAVNYTLDELQKQSRYFKIFKDLNEAYEALKPLDYTVTCNTYLYDVIFPIKFKSIDSFTFTVPIFNSDSHKYKQLIEQYTKRIDRIQRIISGKFDEPPKDAYKPKIDPLKHEVISILTQEEYEWLESIADSKNKRIRLLYHPYKETDKLTMFYQCCSYEYGVYMIIETITGNKFGGYTSCEWSPENEIFEDRTAYLFSFDKRKKYPVIASRKSKALIATNSKIGFNGGIELEDRFMTKNNLTQMINYGYGNAPEEINNGEPFFVVKELFVFKFF